MALSAYFRHGLLAQSSHWAMGRVAERKNFVRFFFACGNMAWDLGPKATSHRPQICK